MASKHLVCDGAICKCKYGAAPDKLKVLTHKKEYINDPKGNKKLTASTKDINTTFEKNTFGPCSKQNNMPCQVIVIEWKSFYDKITLTHGGKVLTEDSKATCPIGGPGCIEIIFHGQVAEISQKNMDNADDAVLAHLYPLGNLKADHSQNLKIPIK
jgi:hypothetical protein